MSNNGALIISNACVASQRPALRLDEHYLDNVLEKFDAAMDCASAHGLVPIFIGDFTLRCWDVAIFRVLIDRFQRYGGATPIVVPNRIHMKSTGELKHNSMVALLAQIGLVETIDELMTPEAFVDIAQSDKRLRIMSHDRGQVRITLQGEASDQDRVLVAPDDPVPSLVRTRLEELAMPSQAVCLDLSGFEPIIMSRKPAPLDENANYNISEESDVSASELAERIVSLMGSDQAEPGDQDDPFRTLFEELETPLPAREIVFGLKDELDQVNKSLDN